MGKWTLETSAKRLAFEDEFIPDGLARKECDKEDNPFEITLDRDILEGEYLIYTSFFKLAGLKLPFGPLLVDFLRKIKFHVGQLTPNVIRIILGTTEINRHFNLNLGINEIKYCYSIGLTDEKWNLKARPHSPSIVEGLSSSYKGYYNDIVGIMGDVEPDPKNKLVPKQFDYPGA